MQISELKTDENAKLNPSTRWIVDFSIKSFVPTVSTLVSMRHLIIIT